MSIEIKNLTAEQVEILDAMWACESAEEYLNLDGTINHKLFYGYAGEFNITDTSKTEIEKVCEDVYDEKINNTEEICFDKIVYPYTKTEKAVDLGREIDVLRQAVYELKQENKEMKISLCKLGEIQWC